MSDLIQEARKQLDEWSALTLHTAGRLIDALESAERRAQEAEKPAPPVGATALCLVCAYEKPWGIWHPSGVAVCVECRDARRRAQEAEERAKELQRANQNLVDELSGKDRY